MAKDKKKRKFSITAEPKEHVPMKDVPIEGEIPFYDIASGQLLDKNGNVIENSLYAAATAPIPPMTTEPRKAFDLGLAPGKVAATFTPGGKGGGVSVAAMSPAEMGNAAGAMNAMLPPQPTAELLPGPDTSKDGQVYQSSHTPGAWEVIYDSSSPTGFTTVMGGNRTPTPMGTGGMPQLPSDERLKTVLSDARHKRLLIAALNPYYR